MDFELDYRPAEPNSHNLAVHKAFFVVRIYPETNAEMAELERISEDFKLEKIVNGNSIQFLVKPKERTPHATK